ncbi:TonB-dependent receptor [Adhaeribacter arboris]|uniref:TonB-dependent receptor n=1 Tax=Adhaeribacter arboris TaxID=2072846 RepID=A0A2T2YCV0_9BACT|nr:TonB-dependent receptor [Adhaeribacter arboris]PSR53316.1 TonB-dependent receptor [Adhaeribacter arboris]
MKNLITLLLILIGPGAVVAQSVNPGKISGSLTDSVTAKPVAYATAALKKENKLFTGTTTEASGAFLITNLPTGNYKLELSFVGYRTKTFPVTLTAEQTTLDLGKIQLSPDTKILSGVTVTGQKALVEDKGDRLVYNAEKDISNAGGTAADVLRKVPTLTVDLNGNVQMRGNSNLKVLVNGKPSAMMARNLADALRQMPANIIKSVEVITSPGAKYDAEGSAGVINIITKKGLQGFNGSTNITAGNFNRSIGTNINYKKKKIGLTLSANTYQYRNQWESENTRTTLFNNQPQNILIQRSIADNTGTGGYGEMSLDFDPDSLSRINFSANVWGGNFPNNSTLYNRLTNPAGQEIQAFRNDRRFRNPYGNGQLDLGYTKTFKKPEQEFSLLTQFSRMPDNYFYDTDSYSLAEQLTYRQHSTNYSRNKEYTVQTDYTHPFTVKGAHDTTSIKLEVGVKGILRDIGSEYRVAESLDGAGELIPNPSQSNDFNYKQQVTSGYTSVRLDTKRKWGLNIGARLEHTDIKGDFVTTQTKLTNQYNNLIPSITLSKGIKTQTFKISYTQRIQRPLIWYLNPWLNASDTLNVNTGNPYLKPELNHATELGYNVTTKKGLSVNTAFYWRYTDNAIEYLTVADPNGVTISKPQNIATRQAYGLNLNVSGQPNKEWNLNGGLDLRYVALRSPALNQSNNGMVWSINFNSTYKLPKDFSLQANGNFGSGWISLQGTNSGYYWYGFAGKREFWDKKASLTLGVNNPFKRSIQQNGKQTAPTFISDNRWSFVNRSVRLTFEWRFGQMTAGGGKQSKKITNDDKGGR